MKDFRFFAPTEVIFGRSSVEKTGECAAKYGKRALLVRSVIVTDSEHVILSALQVETLAPRFGAEDLKERDGETEAAAQPEAERPPRASRRETAPPKKKEKE